MYAIKHFFYVSADRDKIYESLTTHEGIAAWWTEDNKMEPQIGSIAEFNFGEKYRNRFMIIELEQDRLVHWECLEGDEEWIGTKCKFKLEEEGDKTIVRFSHYNWKEDTDFYASCNYHWGLYMKSIKLLAETGKGTPFKISS